MPKYYVKSGQIRYIIDSQDHESAILAALKNYKGRGLISGPRICISEQGFYDYKAWVCYDIHDFMKRT